MRLKSLLLSLLFTASTAGCTAAMRGTVAMKIDPSTAHVRLGKGELAVNDSVRVYTSVCSPNGKLPPICRKEPVADGKVTALLGDEYSVVRFPSGTTFGTGYTVKKVR